MNKDNAKDYLLLVQALVDGKKIEFQGRDGWYALDDPSFDFPADRYRIKPELKEITLVEFRDGSTRIPEDKADAERMVREYSKSFGAKAVLYREVIE